MTQGHLGTEKVALFAWESFKYSWIFPRIPMAAEFLRVNNFNGSVQLFRVFGLPNPVAWPLVLIYPTDEFGCNYLRNATARTATLLHVKIISIRRHFGRILGYAHGNSGERKLQIKFD
jgi:hypothetical protein